MKGLADAIMEEYYESGLTVRSSHNIRWIIYVSGITANPMLHSPTIILYNNLSIFFI